MQGMLELAGVPYVGAGVLGSALGMDKAVQKVLFRAARLPVVPYEVVLEREWQADPEAVRARGLAALGLPAVRQAGHAGVAASASRRCARSDDLAARPSSEALTYDRKVVVEQGVEGAREIECAVLGNDEPRGLGPRRDRPRGRVLRLPGQVPGGGHQPGDPGPAPAGRGRAGPADGRARRSRRSTAPAWRGSTSSTGSRTRSCVNEINTIPGFTDDVDVPQALGGLGAVLPGLDRPAGRAGRRAARAGAPAGPRTLRAATGGRPGR